MEEAEKNGVKRYETADFVTISFSTRSSNRTLPLSAESPRTDASPPVQGNRRPDTIKHTFLSPTLLKFDAPQHHHTHTHARTEAQRLHLFFTGGWMPAEFGKYRLFLIRNAKVSLGFFGIQPDKINK